MEKIEGHKTHRIGWLRAAVLGANDGIVSTASLILGVAAAGASSKSILIAGVAGLVAGAMSMASGEYVSVSSQADTEHADLDRERKELAADPDSFLALAISSSWPAGSAAMKLVHHSPMAGFCSPVAQRRSMKS